MRPSLMMMASASLALMLPADGSAAEFRFAGRSRPTPPHAISNTLAFAVLRNVYEPLVQRGPDLSLQPVLASEWTQVDPPIWQFRLRDGVSYANGNPFNADDVAFSFEARQ